MDWRAKASSSLLAAFGAERVDEHAMSGNLEMFALQHVQAIKRGTRKFPLGLVQLPEEQSLEHQQSFVRKIYRRDRLFLLGVLAQGIVDFRSGGQPLKRAQQTAKTRPRVRQKKRTDVSAMHRAVAGPKQRRHRFAAAAARAQGFVVVEAVLAQKKQCSPLP